MKIEVGSVVKYNGYSYKVIDTTAKIIGQAKIVFLILESLQNKEVISVPYNFVEPIKVQENGHRKNPYDYNDLTTGQFYKLDEVVNTKEIIDNYQKSTILPRRNRLENTIDSLYGNTKHDTTIDTEDYLPFQDIIKSENIISKEVEDLSSNSLEEQEKIVDSSIFNKTNLNKRSQNNNLYDEIEINEITAEIKTSSNYVDSRGNVTNKTLEVDSIENTFSSSFIQNSIANNYVNKTNFIEENLLKESITDEETKKIVDVLEKQVPIETTTLDKEYLDMKNTQDPIFKNFVTEEEIFGNSNILKKLKKKNNTLISLIAFSLIIPILILSAKAIYYFVFTQYANNYNFLSNLNFVIQDNLDGFITMILMISVVPLFIFITLIYTIYYIVSNNNSIQKRFVYNEYKLKQNIEIISEIQNYNNESSVLMLKLHRDNKKIKNKLENNFDSNINNDLEQKLIKH